jgi:hypothetical protein
MMRRKSMPVELQAVSELREDINALLDRLEDARADVMVFPPGNGGPVTAASALRTYVEHATPHQLASVRKQLAEAEGKLLEDERRDEQQRIDDARRDAARWSALTDAEEAERNTLLREAREAAERQNSTEQRLQRIEQHLSAIADALAKR